MRGLDPRIHAIVAPLREAWMTGPSPVMTAQDESQ
jgi:hypothetical protein